MNSLSIDSKQNRSIFIVLTILRAAIGWHFLYEGLTKLFNPAWSAAGYLESATGPLAGLYQALAGNETLLMLVNVLNTWGLVLIGLGLFLGLFTRLSQLAGIALLLLYYLSHPPVFSEPGFFRGHLSTHLPKVFPLPPNKSCS